MGRPQYRRDEGAASAGAGASHQAGGGAAGITIGGAGAVRSRFGRRPEVCPWCPCGQIALINPSLLHAMPCSQHVNSVGRKC